MDLGSYLIDRLGLQPTAHVALVGGGGKTTLLRALDRAGAARGWRVSTGTTTRMFLHQTSDLADFHSAGAVGDKVVGLSAEEMDQCFRQLRPDLLVVEADGSRSKVVKAPADHEPVIPSTATHVLSVIGADGLNRVIEDVAHRPMLVAAVCGCGPYERLTIERAVTLMRSDRGGRRGLPPNSRHVVVLTRVGPRQQAYADEFVQRLERLGTECVALPVLELD